jgi:preprotein translocase subunit SecA
MIARILGKIIGTANERTVSRLRPIVEQINAFEPKISALSDEQLGQQTIYLREQLSQGKSLDELLPEAFATVREAAKRTLGQRHFDVQLMGGVVLHQGKIAEMKTGEGKTLTATLALYLNALTGKGVQLVTVNDYLARRDAQWMSPVYTMLGLSVGYIQNNMSDTERKAIYQNDITYVTNNELGFDYLRDNMKFRLEDYVQRDLYYAIVDEVDSILIDEARTPLIISGSAESSSKLYVDANRVTARLEAAIDYEVDEKARTALFTESGVDKIEAAFHIDNLYAVEHMNLLHHMNQAIRAHALFRRDVEYVVRDNEVLIVDEFTGRILPGRRYSDGLHQAIEAKEGARIERESQTLAAITLQNYFRLYEKLAGMTGTAATEAEEFHNIYKLDVVSIPTNKALARIDNPHLIFLNKNAKYKSIVDDVKERHTKGQPVLVGTASIETSEILSSVLSMSGIKHDVLNAKNHAREAEIIAYAGEAGRVTIATNMAGRGTDIKLTDASKDAGGLYILGTELHESRRIDNQLRGRSGRQGDPGESRFYISLEDDLIRIFAGDSLKRNMERFGMKEDEVIESRFVSKTIDNAQEKVEKRNFEIRKHLIEYDDVLNQQRIVIYQYRRDVLEGHERIYDLIRDFVINVVQDIIAELCPDRSINQAQTEAVYSTLAQLTGIPQEQFKTMRPLTTSNASLNESASQFILEQYDLFRNQKNRDLIQQAEKWLLLETIDQAWKQHMLNLDHLKEGIGLRGWGQKNPLIEYKREAFAMFQDMMAMIRRDVVRHIFRLNIEQFDEREFEEKREQELDQISLNATDTSESAPQNTQRSAEPKVGRNDPCPCGSGKKYKKCHGE